jgi:hypothetical protein
VLDGRAPSWFDEGVGRSVCDPHCFALASVIRPRREGPDCKRCGGTGELRPLGSPCGCVFLYCRKCRSGMLEERWAPLRSWLVGLSHLHAWAVAHGEPLLCPRPLPLPLDEQWVVPVDERTCATLYDTHDQPRFLARFGEASFWSMNTPRPPAPRRLRVEPVLRRRGVGRLEWRRRRLRTGSAA